MLYTYDKVLFQIRRERTTKRISQKEIAKFLWITRAAYNYKERGQRPFTADQFMKLAIYLWIDLSPYDILTDVWTV